jgi:uncharacterized membrane protein HdeD (DUF308 family)
MAAGVLTLSYPDITPVILMSIIAAAWSFAGVIMVLLSILLNIERENGFGLLFSGILSLMAGVYLVTDLHRNVYAILWVVVLYSFLIGILTILFGLKARSWRYMYFDDNLE